VQSALEARKPVSLVFAIPDHPWSHSENSAAVRISMTVGEAGIHDGALLTVEAEAALADGDWALRFTSASGRIAPNLSVGVDVTAAKALRANPQNS
jgi:hypothetical protein